MRKLPRINGDRIVSNTVGIPYHSKGPSYTHLLTVLEHGSEKHRDMALSHLLTGLLEFATSEQGFKSVTKALKEGGKEALDKFVNRLREAPPG